jgi:hypothetical protein
VVPSPSLLQGRNGARSAAGDGASGGAGGYAATPPAQRKTTQLEEDNREMNIRTILQGLSTGVIAVSLSALSHAQFCPSGQTPVTLPTASATFGPFSGDYFSTSAAPGGLEPDLLLPKFNSTNFPGIPAGATLIRATFSARVRLETSGNVGNLGDAPCNGTWGGGVLATIINPGIPALTPYLNCQKNVQRSEPFNGLAPSASIVFPFQALVGHCPTGNNAGEQSVVVTDPAALTPFEGAGNLAFPHLAVVSNFTTSNCGIFPTLTTLNAFVDVFVQYTYCTEGGQTGDCICSGPSPHYRRPGSLLLYPEFDNRAGNVTLVTVTNTKCDTTDGDVRIEIRFINEATCSEDNFTRTLTACDTLSFLTKTMNPNPRQGYLYIYAKNNRNQPIVWNHLIGSLLVISGIDSFDYSVNPVSFRGIGSNVAIEQLEGSLTDLDGDGILDLDGKEYEPAPDLITIPRFLGQDGQGSSPGLFKSQLVLIALSGGQQFVTTLDFCVYNDNEEVFSEEYTFYCWAKPYLSEISPLFSNEWLKDYTNPAPNEILGANHRKAGWMTIQGAVASSSVEDIQDPAFYAVLVERVGSFAAADLPWECGFQFNGALLPRDLLGDGDPIPVNNDNQ